MGAWLDENCDARWLDVDAVRGAGRAQRRDLIYFADPMLDSAFVARWCIGSKTETMGGVFQVREDEPAPRIGVGLHRTP
jgi:hypothetical protein